MSLAVSTKLLETYQNGYDGEVSEWRSLGARDKAANIVELCAAYRHESVLEIGCGEGSILSRLSETGFAKSLHALEISETAVEAVRKRQIQGLVECEVFDGYTVPYCDGLFDVAVLSHVVEHVEHPRQLVYEAARVARLVFVEVPLEDTLRLPHDYVFDTVGHINFYSPKTIRRLMQTCELEVLRQEVTNSSRAVFQYRLGKLRGTAVFGLKQGLLRLSPALATRVLTYNCSLVCRQPESSQVSR